MNTTPNSTYPKVAVQWLNQALCFYQSSCLIDSEVLRNRHLRVAANRYKRLKSEKSEVFAIKSQKRETFSTLVLKDEKKKTNN
jgi:hypothetical protein